MQSYIFDKNISNIYNNYLKKGVIMLYSDIKDTLNKKTTTELIINYNNRQKINKIKNEAIAQVIVEQIVIDPENIPGSYITKLGIILSNIFNSDNTGNQEMIKNILKFYNYKPSQEVIQAMQHIDQYQTADINNSTFQLLMKSLIAIKGIQEKHGLGFSLETDFGLINIARANEVLGIAEISPEKRRQLCHQITSLALLDNPQLYGAYYYIPLAFKGFIEHSVLIDPFDNLVIDLANNATLNLNRWQDLFPKLAFFIKGNDFIKLYERTLDDYNEHLNLATLEEIRRSRKK